VRLCLEEADALDVPMTVGDAVRSVWQAAEHALGKESDYTEIVRPLEERVGVIIKPRA
jgi:hypothetical protein